MHQSTSTADPTESVRPCPFCGSTALLTAGRNAAQGAYVRCRDCGEVWNPARPPLIERRWTVTLGTDSNADLETRNSPAPWRPRLK